MNHVSLTTNAEKLSDELRAFLDGNLATVSGLANADSETRSSVASELLKVISESSGNDQRGQRARQLFIEQGFLEETIRGLRSSKSPSERAADAKILGVVGSSLTTPHLIAALFDSSPEVCRAAAEALSKMEDPAVTVGPLNALLGSEPSHLESALERIRTTEDARRRVNEEILRIETEMQSLIEEEERLFEDVRQLVSEEDERRKREPPANSDEKARLAEFEAFKTSFELELENRRRVAPQTSPVSSAFATNEKHSPIIDVKAFPFEAEVVEPESDATELTNVVAASLHSPHPKERAEAVAKLAMSGAPEAFSLITKRFDDEAPLVRNAAALALHQLDPQRSADSFTKATEGVSPEQRGKIVEAMVDSGLARQAIENLAGHDRATTYGALGLLFVIAKNGEVQPLISAIEEHQNVRVRQAAIRLLTLNGHSDIALAAVNRRLMGGASQMD